MKKIAALATAVILAAVAAPSLANAESAYATTAVNLRAGPGTNYPAIFSLRAGTGLETFGCLRDWSWCDVSVGGYRGWIYSRYLDYPYQNRRVPVYSYGQQIGLPVIEFSVGDYWEHHYRDRPFYQYRSRYEGSQPQGYRGTAYANTTVILRAGPGIDYPQVYSVGYGSGLQTYGCVDDWNWCDVSMNGYRGWVYGGYIDYEYQNRRVPVLTYGAQIGLPVIVFSFGDYWDHNYRNRSFYRDRTRYEHVVVTPYNPTRRSGDNHNNDRNNNDRTNNNNNRSNANGLTNNNARIDGNSGPNTNDHNNDGHNDNGRGNTNTNDHNNDGHNDNGRGNTNTNDHNNDGHNDNGRSNTTTTDHNNDGHNDNGHGNANTKDGKGDNSVQHITPPSKVQPKKVTPVKVAPVKEPGDHGPGNKADNKGSTKSRDGKGGKDSKDADQQDQQDNNHKH